MLCGGKVAQPAGSDSRVNDKCVQLSFLAEELAVEKEDEKVDVDLRPVKHLHHGDAVVLQL